MSTPNKNVKFSKSLRDPLRESDAPGPASYTSRTPNKPSAPAFAFGSSPRTDRYSTSVKSHPGPGAYELLPSPKSGAGPTIRCRHELPGNARGGSPGPGAYDANKPTQAPSFRIVSPLRGSRTRKIDNVPGPGSYVPASPTTKGTVFGRMAKSTHRPARSDGPGPGSYETPDKLAAASSPKFSFAGKYEKKKIEDVPSPATY